ncbi:DUF998 domain-containing protein [Nakamurella panacisegetis]|nr:DUF998 domain-containing protein [Nakamurella panacisegetis]
MKKWVPISASFAPVVPVGAWLLAQHKQAPGYSAVSQTISVLAQPGANDRWIMTAGLFLLGSLQVLTAAGLTEAPVPARVLLGTGGTATALTAVFPQPQPGHVIAAGAAFAAFALWPALARLPDHRMGIVASVLTVAALAWFVSQLAGGGYLGLSERVLAAGEALWPLVVVLSLRAADRPAIAPSRAPSRSPIRH